MSDALPVLDAHRDRLRGAFVDWLLEHRPSSVLDVGAGRGQLVELIGGAGISVRGLEPDGAAAAQARSAGLPVDPGSASALPMEDDSVGWVTLRHVLHHVPAPDRALAEALRVARDGVMVAEPFCASGLAMHALAQRFEGLLRGLDRRRGMFHAEDLSADEILALLPRDWTVEVRCFAPLTVLPLAEAEVLLARSRGDLLPTADELAASAEVLAAAARGALVASGSAVVAARAPLESAR